MNEIQVDTKRMEALRGLADLNIQISNARTALTKLQEIETDYLVSREKKAMERIDGILKRSEDLIAEAGKNYEQITDLSKAVAEGAAILGEAYEAFSEVARLFEERGIIWEKDAKRQEERIEKAWQAIKIDRVKLDNERATVEDSKKDLAEKVRKYTDDRAALERDIKRIQKGKI